MTIATSPQDVEDSIAIEGLPCLCYRCGVLNSPNANPRHQRGIVAVLGKRGNRGEKKAAKKETASNRGITQLIANALNQTATEPAFLQSIAAFA